MLIKIKNKMGTTFNELGCMDCFGSRILILDSPNAASCAHRIPGEFPRVLRDVRGSGLLHTGKLTGPRLRASK